MKRFLIVFDRAEGRVLRLDECDTPSSALRARLEAERLPRGNRNVEVVVLGANSKDALKTTHARYFDSLRHLGKDALRRVKEVRAHETTC